VNLCVFFGLHKHFYVNQDIGRFCRSSVIIISLSIYTTVQVHLQNMYLCASEKSRTIRYEMLF